MSDTFFVVGYNGLLFHGSQVQPNVPTVTSLVSEALLRLDALNEESKIRFHSRTDQKVSAVMNLLQVELKRSVNLKALNYLLNKKGIAILAQGSTKPRVQTKRYLYVLREKHYKGMSWRDIASRLMSFKEVSDFTAFIKPDKRPRNTKFKIIDTLVKRRGKGLLLEIEGTGFGWQQIRRMIGFVLDRRFQKELPQHFEGVKKPLNVKVMEPHYLLLKRMKFEDKLILEEIVKLNYLDMEGVLIGQPLVFQQVFYEELSQLIHVLNTLKGR